MVFTTKHYLVLILIFILRISTIQAQTLTVSGGTTINITSNTYYDAITVQNNGVLNVIAPAVLTVGATGTSATTQVVDFQNGSTFLLATGATMIVNGRLNNSNNSDKVVVNGTLTVNGNISGGSGSTIVGNGTATSTGTITGAGTFFGNSNDCTTGPCNANNLCSFSTANTITASGTISHCTSTNTTPILNGSAITSATYQWRSSSSFSGTYSNVSGGTGATSQNYTPPTNLGSTIYYRRDATVSSCTQISNIITVTIGGTPSITIQPSSSQTVCVGNAATFSITAIGTGLSYQWRKGTTNISGATASTYTLPSVTTGDAATNYNCVVTSTCSAPNTATSNNATLVVTNTSLPTVTASTSASFCVGGTLSLTGTRSGGTGTLVSAWVGPNGYASSNTLSPTVSSSATAAMAGTYIHTVTDANGCKSSANATTSSLASGTWRGTSDASWNTSGNWCGGIPSSTTDVIIPSGTSFTPQITGSAANARNLTINLGATLSLASSQTLNMYGNFINNGTFTDNGGTINFIGTTAQSTSNLTSIKNLTLNNSNGLTLNSASTVTGILTLTSGALTSNGNLTVNLSTGTIAPSGLGSVVGNMTVVRNSSDFSTGSPTSNFHYIGSPLDGTTFADFNDDIPFTSSNFFAYNEGDFSGTGSSAIQRRWKRLFTRSLTTVINSQIFTGGPSAMVGYALNFNRTSPQSIDLTGTYTHGSSVSFTTGNMSYTSSGTATSDGWQLIANPFPSYVDWRLASTSNLESAITFYNSLANNNAEFIPANPPFGESFNNGGSPFIPAMQAFWVQVKPAGNGSVTFANSARVTTPTFTGYSSVPSFYRIARATAKSFKLMAKNSKGSDETSIRFGKGATNQFDGKLDLYKLGANAIVPTISSSTEGIEYAINSLPEITNDSASVNINIEIPSTDTYFLFQLKTS